MRIEWEVIHYQPRMHNLHSEYPAVQVIGRLGNKVVKRMTTYTFRTKEELAAHLKEEIIKVFRNTIHG